jgi:hypothetical protein
MKKNLFVSGIALRALVFFAASAIADDVTRW